MEGAGAASACSGGVDRADDTEGVDDVDGGRDRHDGGFGLDGQI